MTRSVDAPRLSSEFGSGRGGWDKNGAIVRESFPVTNDVVEASINVGANQAAGITIQLLKADGSAIARVQRVKVYVLLNATPTGLAATGGSTGIAIGADGFIAQTLVAKKIFDVFSKNNGSIKLSWTDNAAEAAFLGVELPNGRMVVSAALPTA